MRGARRPDEGYILVAVLSVMLVLTCFMAAGSVLVRSALDSAKVTDGDVAIEALTRGGLELAAYQLFVVKLPPAIVEGRRIKFAGGTVSPHVVDEAGKIDLNGADPKVLAALFTSTGMGSSDVGDLVARILAARGTDTTSNNATPSADKPHRRGFQSVGQLADFPELTRSDLKALTPRLTVFNPDGKINILSASRSVLTAMPGLSDAVIEDILQRRKSASKDIVESLQAALGEAGAYAKTTFGPGFDVRIDATAASGRKKTVEAIIASSKSPNDPYYVLEERD